MCTGESSTLWGVWVVAHNRTHDASWHTFEKTGWCELSDLQNHAAFQPFTPAGILMGIPEMNRILSFKIVLFCSISADGEVKSFKHNCTWPTMAAINDRDTYRPTGSWKSGQKRGCPCSILDCSLHISDITYITWLIIINSQNSKKTYPDHIHHIQRLLNLFSFPPRRHGHGTDWGCWNQSDLSRCQEALVVGPCVEVYSCIRFNCWHSIRYLFFSWL